MPDNAKNIRYVFKTEFDPAGTKAAQQGLGDVSSAFNTLGAQMERTNFGRALKDMKQLEGVLPQLGAAGLSTATNVAELTEAAVGLRKSILAVETGAGLLRAQFDEGFVSKKAFKEGMSNFRAMRAQLKKINAAEFAQSQTMVAARLEEGAAAKVALAQLREMNLPISAFAKSVRGSTVDLKILAAKLPHVVKSEAELAHLAEIYTTHLRHQRKLEEELAGLAKDRASGASLAGSLKEAASNLGTRITKPFKEALGYATRIPTLISEGLKDKVAVAFSAQGFIGKTATRMVKSVFSKKALLLGPLGAVAEFAALGGKQKERPGFVSGGGDGPLGVLGKSLGSFGGLLKTITHTLAPMALLMKMLAPVFQTLQWVLEPLMAPLQKLLSDVVLALVPFFADLAGIIKELADQLLPPFLDLVKALGPVLIDLARMILPPLVKLLKLTITWFTKIVVVIMKVLGPVLKWFIDAITWVADGIMGVLEWFGFDTGVKSKEDESKGPGAEDPGQTPAFRPAVNRQGKNVAGPARAMTVTEAGGNRAYQKWSERQSVAKSITQDPEQEMEALDKKIQARFKALQARPDKVDKPDPDKMAEPVVQALQRMTQQLLVVLPKRIGQETKSITLSDFSAVTA